MTNIRITTLLSAVLLRHSTGWPQAAPGSLETASTMWMQESESGAVAQSGPTSRSQTTVARPLSASASSGSIVRSEGESRAGADHCAPPAVAASASAASAARIASV